MLDSLSVSGGLMAVLFGAGLIYESVSSMSANSAALLLAGAGLLTLGVLMLLLVMRSRRRRAWAIAEMKEEHRDETQRSA